MMKNTREGHSISFSSISTISVLVEQDDQTLRRKALQHSPPCGTGREGRTAGYTQQDNSAKCQHFGVRDLVFFFQERDHLGNVFHLGLFGSLRRSRTCCR